MSCKSFPSSCDLRTEITIERFTPAEDVLGGRIRSWIPIETTFAMVKEGGGSESGYAGGRRSTCAYTATIRWTNINASDRIVMDSVAYNIESIEDISMRHIWLKVSLLAPVPT
jgi:head-tail adaptor